MSRKDKPQPNLVKADVDDLLAMSPAARTRLLLKLYDLRPRRTLSQNFLVNEAAAEAIAQAIDVHSGSETLIVEIGARLGALTIPLARLNRDLIAFETDEHLVTALDLLLKAFPDVTLKHADITKEPLEKLAPDRRLAVVGNLPYHITGLLLQSLMELGHRCDVIVVTVQAEVAQRLAARAGDEQYGILSICAAYYLERVATLQMLGPDAFMPQPDVSSVALVLQPRCSPTAAAGGLTPAQERLLLSTVKAGFAHRRKTLRNSMAMSNHLDITKDQLDQALAEAGIDGDRRGESLELDDFVKLALAVERVTEAR